MKRLFLSAAVALFMAFGLSSAPAEAGTITLIQSTFVNLGGGDSVDAHQLTPGSFVVSHDFGSHNSTFVDTFKFAVVGLKTSLNFDIKTWGTVNPLTVNLYDQTGAGPALQTWVINSTTPTDTYTKITGALLASIVAQPFVFLQVTGAVCACAAYQITTTPVPPALILFLTALGGMALVGFRRSKGGALLRTA